MYECSEWSVDHMITRNIMCNILQLFRRGYNLLLQSNPVIIDCGFEFMCGGVS